METGVLKSFAGEARRQLLSEVRARLGLVLAEGSTQRREYADVVRKLESAVGEAGGGEAGRDAVVDRVAYTWFNRIVALRFMDANGFTDVGVVSPAVDRPDGQPEVLVEAKRGVIDTDVAAPPDTQRIAGLLGGSVTSADPESEAFGLLLAAYCRFWNRSMPFMFEHSADYTELLMPADLLSDESVIASAVTVLTPEVCADVEVIGWLYQFYIAERKDEVFAGFKKGKKAGAAEIPAATQLFTPDWIVRYLVENSLGRLWMLNRPDSTLVDRMDYYIAPIDEETDFLRIESPEEIKVMDPACGSGHMLTYSFDLLFAMYEEDGYNPADIPALILSRNLYGTEIDQRAGALAAFALTMKARTRQRTFFTKNVIPNICVLGPVTFTTDELNQLVSPDGDRDAEEAFFTMFTDADTLGALIQPDEALLSVTKARVEGLDAADNLFNQDLTQRARQVVAQAEYLTSRYHTVVANPPYMDGRNMSEVMRAGLGQIYPESVAGLDTVFVSLALELLLPSAFAALITMDSWMANVEYRNFRQRVAEIGSLRSLVHLGPRAFPEVGGEVVRVVAFVVEKAESTWTAVFVKATSGQAHEKVAQFHDHRNRFTRSKVWFEAFPDSSLTGYSAPDSVRNLFATCKPLGASVDVRTGLQSGDNDRFIRNWFEVSFSEVGRGSDTSARWVPYVKSKVPYRWFAGEELVVDWQADGRAIRRHPSSVVRNQEYYFKSGVSYNGISNQLCARLIDPGAIFDQQNSVVFAASESESLSVLSFLNSSAAEYLARQLSGKRFGVGTLQRIPDPLAAINPSVPRPDPQPAVEAARLIWDSSESSMGFASQFVPGWVAGRAVRMPDWVAAKIATFREWSRDIREVEENVDSYFRDGLGIQEPMRARVDMKALEARSVVTDLVSYAVGCMFGRYGLDEPGLILANQGDTLKEYLARIPEPSFVPDEDNVIPVLADDWFDDDIVEQFRLFLRVAFGEERFEENLRFVEESLGKDIRKYFLTDFYKDHVQRYKKRPIYWMFSSPKGTFNALIYIHRYSPSAVSTVLNEYLREFQAKLDAELGNQARIAADRSASARDKARAEKESDKIRKMLAELRDYEHDVLYPLASRQISIDLDDGVKANYPKFGTALKKIPGLEATND